MSSQDSIEDECIPGTPDSCFTPGGDGLTYYFAETESEEEVEEMEERYEYTVRDVVLLAQLTQEQIHDAAALREDYPGYDNFVELYCRIKRLNVRYYDDM